MNSIRYLCVILLFSCTSAFSQESSDWDWKITPYLWMMGIEGSLAIGDLEQDIDASFGDLLSDLEIAGEIYAEIGKGKHAFHVDYSYFRLRPDATPLPSPPFLPDADLKTKITMQLFETAYNYRWNGPDGPALVLGARMTDMSMRMNPGNLPAITTGPSWWDYFVGIKTHNAISANWDFDFYGTAGAGDSDFPWTLQAVFARRFSNDNRLGLGFRAWNTDYSKFNKARDAVVTMDTKYYGLMIGYEFN